MESVKSILNFRNAAVFYDYTNVGITVELSQVRKCIINSFYKTIPYSRILVRLSMIDDIVLKINNSNIEYIIGNVHDPRENILYLLSFEKLVRDEQETDDDNDEKYTIHFWYVDNTDFVNFLEDGIRYNVEFFKVDEFFNGLSNDVSHFVVAQNFIISTCLRYVDIVFLRSRVFA